MMQSEKSSRVDVMELKALMLKKIGIERFKRYFYSLERFINHKLSKSDFDRSCFQILGRENLPLHNQIIKSILKNACNSKIPPQVRHVGPTNPSIAGGRSSTIIEDASGQGSFLVQNQSAQHRSNGVALPVSPRKVRSVNRRDRPSPLGQNGKLDSASHQSTATEDSGGTKIVDNGNLIPGDYHNQRQFQHLQGLGELHEKFPPMIKKCLDIPGAMLGKDKNCVSVAVEEGEEVEQANRLNISKSPLIAPLGIPYCFASIGGARKPAPVASGHSLVSCFDSGVLSDSESLSKRMEQIAASHGLPGGVTMECANSLNTLLDVYLKRLIRSCVTLVGESSSSSDIKHPAQRQESCGRLVNGIWPGNQLQMSSGGAAPLEGHRFTTDSSISLLEFKVAMELNPELLGENRPIMMEKISMQAFEE